MESFVDKKNMLNKIIGSPMTDLVVLSVVCIEVSFGDATSFGLVGTCRRGLH